MQKDITFLKALTRKVIRKEHSLVTADVFGNKYCIITTPAQNQYWLKVFRSKCNTFAQECDMIQKASDIGVAPKVTIIQTKQKFVFNRKIRRKNHFVFPKGVQIKNLEFLLTMS